MNWRRNINKFKQVSYTILLCWLVSGCVNTKTQYPDFPDQVKNRKGVSVIIDAIAFSDIKGRSLGFNVDKNKEMLAAVSNAVSESLIERGFEPTFIAELNGLFYELDEEDDYVYSEDWESTNEPFTGMLDVNQEHDSWYAIDVKEFFSIITEKGLVKENNSLGDNKLPSSVPLILQPFRNELVLYVQVKGGFHGVGKKIGLGLLSAAITSGFLIVAPSPTEVKIAAIDLSNMQTLWFKSYVGGNYMAIDSAVKEAFSKYPKVDGNYLSRKLKRRPGVY